MRFDEADTDKGRRLLRDWFDQEDLGVLEDSLLTEGLVMVQRYTGSRPSPAQLKHAVAALVVRTASKFEKVGD